MKTFKLFFSLMAVQALIACQDKSEVTTSTDSKTLQNVSSVTHNGNQITCTSRLNSNEVVTLVLERLSNGNVKIVNRYVETNTSTSILKESYNLEMSVSSSPVENNTITLTSSSQGQNYFLIPFDGSGEIDVTAPIGAGGLQVTCECCTTPGSSGNGQCAIDGEIRNDFPYVYVFNCHANNCNGDCGMDSRKNSPGGGVATVNTNQNWVLVAANAIEY